MKLISVNLGQERTLQRNGHIERTGIFKTPTEEAVKVTELGLEGDVVVSKSITVGRIRPSMCMARQTTSGGKSS